MKTRRYNVLLNLLILSSLTGCTQKFKDVSETVSASINSYKDVQIKKEDLLKIKYDSIYVRINEGKRILMILAHIDKNMENNQWRLKWVSSDNVLIITEKGRIVKTIGFQSNLSEILMDERSLTPSASNSEFHLLYNWSPGYRYNFTAIGSSKVIGEEKLLLSNWELKSTHIIESISFKYSDSIIENHYWINKDNKVIKSIQYLGPNMDKVEISFVKDFIQ